MRAILPASLALAFVACHPTEPPKAAAPKGPTACARASDNLVQLMLDHLPSKEAPPTEEADALRNLIRERCEEDRWSTEAVQCLYAMKQLEDAEPCSKLMTEDQQAALVRDQQARFGAAGASGGPAGGAAGVPGGRAADGTPGGTGSEATGSASEDAGAPAVNGGATEPRR